MHERHFVIGAGPVGHHVAQKLAAMGADVTVATRSGSSPPIPGVDCVQVDASDPAALTQSSRGFDVIYNCANPGDYTAWKRTWPPLAAAILYASEMNQTVLAIAGNLYPYGPVQNVMTEDCIDRATDVKGALRAQMWADARAAHEAGRVSAVEVRGSDYVGAGVGANGHVSRQLPAMQQGKTLRVLGSPDLPHSWTEVSDMAAALITAAADPGTHGRIWFAPTNSPRTQRQALSDVAAAGGYPEPTVAAIPTFALAAAGWFSPLVRELRALEYQWKRPYVIDDSVSRERLGLEPTSWDEVCRRTSGQPGD